MHPSLPCPSKAQNAAMERDCRQVPHRCVRNSRSTGLCMLCVTAMNAALCHTACLQCNMPGCCALASQLSCAAAGADQSLVSMLCSQVLTEHVGSAAQAYACGATAAACHCLTSSQENERDCISYHGWYLTSQLCLQVLAKTPGLRSGDVHNLRLLQNPGRSRGTAQNTARLRLPPYQHALSAGAGRAPGLCSAELHDLRHAAERGALLQDPLD